MSRQAPWPFARGQRGMSTQKLHTRDPMGLEALTTDKWLVRGDGHTWLALVLLMMHVLPQRRRASTFPCFAWARCAGRSSDQLRVDIARIEDLVHFGHGKGMMWPDRMFGQDRRPTSCQTQNRAAHLSRSPRS